MTYQRAHPINIIESTSKFYILLLLPILRGLFFSGGNLYIWLTGAWFDILIIAAIFLLGYIRWYFNMFRIGREGIFVFKGIFMIKKEFFSYEKIASVTVESPFYFRPFKAVRLKLDTDAGHKKSADFSLTMRKKDAQTLFEIAKGRLVAHEQMARVYSPKLLYIAVLSLISSNSLTGVLFASTLISQSGNLLGKEFEQGIMSNLTKVVEILALGLPPIAAIIAYVIAGGWLIAFLQNVIRHKNFTAIRQNNSLTISAGVFTLRNYSIDVRQINLVDIHQTLTTKIFGFYSVFIHCSGYGKQKNEISVLIPAAEKHDAMRNLELLLPEIKLGKKNIRPKMRNLSRFILVPSLLIAGLALAIVVCYQFFPAWSSIVLFLGIMIELPFVWYLIVRIFSFTHTGIGMENDMFTIYYTKRFLFNRVAIPEQKVSKIVLKQSLFQRKTNCCDVVFYSYSEGKRRHTVQNLNYPEVSTLLMTHINQ